MTNTILTPEQIQLLNDAGIRHNFPTNPKLVNKRFYRTKDQGKILFGVQTKNIASIELELT